MCSNGHWLSRILGKIISPILGTVSDRVTQYHRRYRLEMLSAIRVSIGLALAITLMDNNPAVLLGFVLRVYFRVSFSMVRDVLVLISVHVVVIFFGCTCPGPFLCPLFCIPSHCLQPGLPHILEKMTASGLWHCM